METEKSTAITPKLMLVAWETTRRCNLYCSHCRASSENNEYPDELTTEDCFRVIREIREIGQPILILSGGEPLLRPDIFEVGKYAANQGFTVVMGTNGTLVTGEMAAKMAAVPIPRISISLDFPTAELQDKFRGQAGAFIAAIEGIKNAQKAGIGVQINCTITRLNVAHLPAMIELALNLKAVAFHPFMLVPTGRGKGLADLELSPEDYEKTLKWIYRKQIELGDRINFKPTDAPHYWRIARQCGSGVVSHGHSRPTGLGSVSNMNSLTRGCLAGVGFCFISHTGKVKGCGYLDIEAGDLKSAGFGEIWENSPLFRQLRDISNLKGKCRVCEFKKVCGGCRARAFETTGDYLAAEPYCIYTPNQLKEVTTI